MILIVNMCVSSLHSLEFVNPVVRCLRHEYKVVHYTKLTSVLIEAADCIIICGTALIDNSFVDDAELFLWLKETKKPVLGICAGMEIMALINDGQLQESLEIGLTKVMWQGQEKEVYTLHTLAPTCPPGFDIIAQNEKCIHAIQKGNKLGVLFHPEVRNQEIITDFICRYIPD